MVQIFLRLLNASLRRCGELGHVSGARSGILRSGLIAGGGFGLSLKEISRSVPEIEGQPQYLQRDGSGVVSKDEIRRVAGHLLLEKDGPVPGDCLIQIAKNGGGLVRLLRRRLCEGRHRQHGQNSTERHTLELIRQAHFSTLPQGGIAVSAGTSTLVCVE